jgi:hypothetical protein
VREEWIKQHARLELLLYEMLIGDIREVIADPIQAGWKHMLRTCWAMDQQHTFTSPGSHLNVRDQERMKKEALKTLTTIYREVVNASYASYLMSTPGILQSVSSNVSSAPIALPIIIGGGLYEHVSGETTTSANHVLTVRGYALRGLLEYATGTIIGSVSPYQQRGRYDCHYTHGILLLESKQLRLKPSDPRSALSWPITDFQSTKPAFLSHRSNVSVSVKPETPWQSKYDVQHSLCTTRHKFSNALQRLRDLKNVWVIVKDPWYLIWKTMLHVCVESISESDRCVASVLQYLKDQENAEVSEQREEVSRQEHKNRRLLQESETYIAMKAFYVKHNYFLFFDFVTFHSLFASDVEATLQHLNQHRSTSDEQIQHVIQYSVDSGPSSQSASVADSSKQPERLSFLFASYEAIAYSAFALFNEDVMPELQRLWDSRTDTSTDPSLPKLVNSSFFPSLIQERSGLPFQRSRVGCAFSLVPEVDEELIMTDIPALHAFYTEHPKIREKVQILIKESWAKIGLKKEQKMFAMF